MKYLVSGYDKSGVYHALNISAPSKARAIAQARAQNRQVTDPKGRVTKWIAQVTNSSVTSELKRRVRTRATRIRSARRNPSQVATLVARGNKKIFVIATDSSESNEALLNRANAIRVIKRVNTNPNPAKIDAHLLKLASAYKGSKDARARNMIRGKAQRLINKTYTVKANRDAVWDEWRKIAGGWVANPSPLTEWDFEDLADEGAKMGSQVARALGQGARAHAKEPKRYNVTWYSPRLGKRTGFIRPIEADTQAAAKAQAKAMITNDPKASNFIAKEAKRNPKRGALLKLYAIHAKGGSRTVSGRGDIGAIEAVSATQAIEKAAAATGLPKDVLTAKLLKRYGQRVNPTRTSTEVKSPTKTSTWAKTEGNITVTGGAGEGATTKVIVNRKPNPKMSDELRQAKRDLSKYVTQSERIYARLTKARDEGNEKLAAKLAPQYDLANENADKAARNVRSAQDRKTNGRSTTPPYRLEIDGQRLSWRGPANNKALAKYVFAFAKSLQPGGANEHLAGDMQPPSYARIIRQSTGEVVAEWRAGTFQVYNPESIRQGAVTLLKTFWGHKQGVRGRIVKRGGEYQLMLKGSQPATVYPSDIGVLFRYGDTKTNPATAREMSERFNGRATGSVTELKASNRAPRDLSRAGKLVFLKLKNAKAQLKIPGAVVCIDPKTERLWIAGNRTPLLNKRANPGEALDFGEIDRICYETAKAHIGDGKTVEYVHTFGEDGGRKPRLQVDAEGMPVIVGGDYKIKAEGIVN